MFLKFISDKVAKTYGTNNEKTFHSYEYKKAGKYWDIKINGSYELVKKDYIQEIYNSTEVAGMALDQIARVIINDWEKVSKRGPNDAAREKLSALAQITHIDDRYMFISGRELVTRLLGDLNTWRGGQAQIVKIELKKRLGR